MKLPKRRLLVPAALVAVATSGCPSPACDQTDRYLRCWPDGGFLCHSTNCSTELTDDGGIEYLLEPTDDGGTRATPHCYC